MPSSPRAALPCAISPRLTAAGQPDVRSLRALLAGPPFAGLRGEALAVAIWQFLCERLYHYCAPAETEYGRNFIYDPVTLLNGFGFTICGVTANTLGLLFQAAGFPARIAFIRGHEGTEVFYDGRWHFFDADLQAFHRHHAPQQHIVASREDCFRDPTLVSHQQHPSNPYYIPDRNPAAVAKLFEETPRYEFVIGEQAHSMDFVLRPGESIEYGYQPASPTGRWICFDAYRQAFQQFPREPGPGGPQDRFGQGRSYANGTWRYALDFRTARGRAAAKTQTTRTLRASKGGLTVTAAQRAAVTGSLVLSIACPYPFAGVPDSTFAAPPREGVMLRLKLRRKTGAEQIALRIRRDSTHPWQTLSGLAAETTFEADLTPVLAGHFQCDLALDLTAPAGSHITLEHLDFTGCFVCAPASLPQLQQGVNEWQFRTGDERGLPSQATRRFIRFDAPDAHAALQRHGIKLVHGRLAPGTPELLQPHRPGRSKKTDQPYRLILPLTAPAGREIHWFYLVAHVQARLPGTIDDGGIRLEIAATPRGPWRLVEHFPLEEHPHRWHFSIDRTTELAGYLGAPASRCFVRLTTRAGLLGLRWRVHHCARQAEPPAPVRATLRWQEGRQAKSKTAIVSPHQPTLSIPCKRRPLMQSLRLETLEK